MFEPTGVINEIAVLASEHSLPRHRWPVAMGELRLRLAHLCVCGCREADQGENGGALHRPNETQDQRPRPSARVAADWTN